MSTDKATPQLMDLAAHNRLAIQLQAQHWLDAYAESYARDTSEELKDARLIIGDLLQIAYRTPPPAHFNEVVAALETIERWEFPKVKDRNGDTVSYGAAYGSNGEHDFMREVARKALAAVKPEREA